MSASVSDELCAPENRCARCGAVSIGKLAACPECLSPLSNGGRYEGLHRPVDLGPFFGWIGKCLIATAAVYFAVMPNSPVHAIRERLFGPPPLPPRIVAVPLQAQATLAKFEPPTGCILGAFVINDVNIGGKMDRWEALTGKAHGSYLNYCRYGQPFPKKWVASVRALGAVPNIALEPNGGLYEVMDLPYLREWSRDAAESGGPVFLRFASEMNGPWTAYHGDAALYRERFRTVAEVMREEAPNVAMVWTPYCSPVKSIPDYYPGDDAVDWVGVNIYSVHHHDGKLHKPAHREDPTELLRPVYELYAGRKPIQISEYASTHTCKACGGYTADFAMNKMIRLYRSLPERFPRVKSIYWFSYDTITGKAAENNYSVIDDPVIRDTYRRLIAPDYFLSSIPEGLYWAKQKTAPRPPSYGVAAKNPGGS